MNNAISLAEWELTLDAATASLMSYTRASIHNYVISGQPLGGFLTAVFSNDLMKALRLADEHNRMGIHHYITVLSNVPALCWGNPKRVQIWSKIRGIEGLMEMDPEKRARCVRYLESVK